MSTPAERLAEMHNAEVRAKKGHNSDPKGQVQSFADRLENLETEKKQLGDDIRDLKTEAKDAGVDPKALAAVVKQRMEDADRKAARLAHEAVVDQYKMLLGLLD